MMAARMVDGGGGDGEGDGEGEGGGEEGGEGAGQEILKEPKERKGVLRIHLFGKSTWTGGSGALHELSRYSIHDTLEGEHCTNFR
jgi:hypothetical protein